MSDFFATASGTAIGDFRLNRMEPVDGALEAARIQARELVASARGTCAESARIIRQSCEAVEHSRQLLAEISNRESEYLKPTSSGSHSEIVRLALK